MEYFSGSKKILQFIMEDWKLLLFLTLVFCAYFYYTSTFDFFEKKGVKFMKPTIIFGNLGPRLSNKTSYHTFHLGIYNYFKGNPFGGFFEGRKPVLIILDPDIIKAVTIRDFEYFVDKYMLGMREARYITQSLLHLKGSEWKAVRSTLTPAFSSARLKNMLPLIEHCSQQLNVFLKQFDGKDVEMKETVGHFTLEVIGACAFGIKCDALSGENDHFIKVAENFNYMSKSKRFILLAMLTLMPQMMRFFNLSFLNTESVEELIKILQKAKAERRTTGIKKNDFLQLLVDAADSTENEDSSESQKSKAKACLDEDTIDAQTLLFLLAGYETSSTLLSLATHVLATRPDLQDTLREYIEKETSGKEISYELLSQLSYLEGFLLETLRLYPPVARVDRVCVKPYILPGTSVHINPGEIVTIPVYGIHLDPDYYPDPEQFRPERFIGDAKKERPSHLFLAFGAGPRNCIGLRFAMISAKLVMVMLLKNFKFSTCAKTKDPVQFDKRAVLLKAEGGLWVRLDKI